MRKLPDAISKALAAKGIKTTYGRSRYNVDTSDAGKATRTVNGILFPSVAHAEYYKRLMVMRENGDISFVIREIPFDLPGNTRHRVDFGTFTRIRSMDGRAHPCAVVPDYIEIKGHDTAAGRRARKQVEAIYNIKIRVLRAVRQRRVIVGFEEIGG